MTEIESLGISIKADAKTAGNTIDDLVDKLTGLTVALGKIDGNNKLSGFSQGVQAFATAMQGFKGIGTEKFNAITTGITNLSNLNTQGLNTVSGSITNISNSLGILSRIQFDNKNIQSLINSLTRMASADISKLSKVDFTSLGNSLNNLATSLQNAPKIEQSVIAMTKAITSLSKYGGNMPVVASSLGALGNSLTMFMSTMANAPRITDSALAFTQAISSLAGAGAKAGVTASNLSALGVGIRNIMTTLSTAPKVSQNVIDMTNALANLSAQGSKVGSASRNMVYGLNRTSRSADRAKKSFSGLASVIGKFYANYFLVVRGFKALWKSIGSTSDYVESFNYYTVSFGKIASKWDKEWKNYGDENARNYSNAFVTTMNDTLKKLSGVSYNPKTGLLSETGLKNLGLNIQEVTNYAAQLASMMDSIGQNGQVTLATTKAFVKLAGDISSLKNIDYSDAANKIQSVLMGQSRAGYSLGWDTTMASLQATADSLNLSKSVSEMAQFEKQQLRILTILEQSRVAWGDQSNTINTLSNQIRLFRNNIKEAGLLVGQLFTPIMVNLMPVINGVTIALKRMLSYLGIALGANMKDVSQGFNDMEDGAFDMSEGIDGATESLKKYKNQAMDFDEINPIKGVDDSGSLGSLTGGSIDLTDEILQATKEYEKAWQESYDNMESRSQEIASRIVEGFKNAFEEAGWGGVGQHISDSIASSLNSADWESVNTGLTTIANNIANFLNGLITPELLGAVGTTFAQTLNAVINAKATLGENINFDQVGEAIATGINDFFDTFDFERLGESINTWVQGLTKALIKAVKEIDWNDVIKGFGELITSLDPETILILTSLWFLRGGGLPGIGFGGNKSGGGFVAGATTTAALTSPTTAIAGITAAIIGSLLGEDAGRKVFGDEAYDEYGTVESILGVLTNLSEIKPEWVEQSYNAFINGLIGSDGLLDQGINKLITFLGFGEKTPEEKEVAKSETVAGAGYVPAWKKPIHKETTDEEWANFFENQIPQIYKEEAVKLGIKWEVGGKTIDFLNIGTEAETAGGNIVDGLSTGITSKDSATTSIAKSMGSIASKMVETYGTLSGKAKTQGSGIIWNLGQGIKGSDSAKTAIGTIASGITSIFGSKYNTIKSDVSSKGSGIVDGLASGISGNDSADSAISTSMGSVVKKMTDKYGILSSKAKTQGSGIVWNLGQGVKTSNSATTAVNAMASGVETTLEKEYNTIKSDASSKGKGLVWNLGQGIIKSDSATTAFTNLFASLSKIANKDEVKTDFVTAGKNIIEGLVKGLKDPKTLLNLATTVADLGGTVAGIFKGLLDINSPSGLFEEYAMYTIQGYNLGIEKYAPTTVDTMEDWGSMITDASMTLEPQYLGNANSEEILLLRQQNMLLQALLNKEAVEIKGDAKQIFKVVQKQANNYTIQTGEPAFI